MKSFFGVAMRFQAPYLMKPWLEVAICFKTHLKKILCINTFQSYINIFWSIACFWVTTQPSHFFLCSYVFEHHLSIFFRARSLNWYVWRIVCSLVIIRSLYKRVFICCLLSKPKYNVINQLIMISCSSSLYNLQINTTLTKINLMGNNIGETGMLYLQVMMSENTTITSLVSINFRW